ncbi:MAG: porin family protein [Deltaproteobacteria bacterium]|nr:porin family protein [Deltaproteobacteria bacterium]
MFQRPQTIKVVAMAVLLLLSLLAKTALAVPVTVHGGKVVQLNKRQVELLKQQPAVYYLRTAPDKLFKHYILVELPDELGGGFFLARPADMAAALEAAGAIERTEGTRMAATAPSKERWFADLYAGGVVPEDGNVNGEASPFGVSISDSAKADYDNTYVVGGRVGFWSPGNNWIGLALDVSYFELEAEGTETKVLPVSALVILRYPGDRLQPYMGIGGGVFFTDTKVDIQLSGQNKNFSDTAADFGLDTRAGLAWRLSKGLAIFGEYRFTYFEADYSDKINSGGTESDVNIEIDSKVHYFLIGFSYRF